MIIQINELHNFDIHNIKLKTSPKKKQNKINIDIQIIFKKNDQRKKKGGKAQKTITLGRKLSFILSFFFLSACWYIYFHCSYLYITTTTTIISLEPCALDAEFHHFILRYNEIS
jgi:zona occludens toxin (predicted ATPase)